MQNMIKSNSTNPNCVTDNNYSVQLLRWLLKPIGIWPKSSTKSESTISTILMVLSLSAIVSPTIPCAMYTALAEEEMQIKLKAVAPLGFWVMTCIKMISLIFHGNDIKQCLDEIEVDWCNVKTDVDRKIMLNSAKVGRYLVTFSTIFMFSAVSLYNIARNLTTVVRVVGNQSIKVRTLPVPFYDGIVDTQQSPTYEIIFAAQLFSGFVVNQVTTGACSLTAIFVMHACGQLRVVMMWLKSLFDTNDNFQKKQADIVEQHLKTLSFIARTEDIMNQICFLEITYCTVDLCLLAYYLVTEWEQSETTNTISYLIVLMSIAFNIFIFCYIGEILSEECRQVGESAYMTEWYLLPGKTALSFVLIISRSRFVMKLTAGKIIHLSLATFSNVIRTAFAYFNILRQMT